MNENTDGSGFGLGGLLSFGPSGVSGTVVAGNSPTAVVTAAGCASGACPGSFQSNLPLIIVGVVVLVLVLR